MYPRCGEYDICRKDITSNLGESLPPVDLSRSIFNRGIGFLSAAYNKLGGTETFHRLLVPRLRNVGGFVATAISGGDPEPLACPYADGIDAARQLAAVADVLVVWGVDNLAQILPKQRPPVVMVHHGSMASTWGHSHFLSQPEAWDVAVTVNAEVADYLRYTTGKIVHHIPNAVDPLRCRPTQSPDETRRQYGLGTNRIVLWGHRLSNEKRPILASEIARSLPAGWLMVMAGSGAVKVAEHDKVRLVGRVDSLGDLLAVSDAFLSTADQEGFGLSVAEAMLSGVPVVSPPLGIAADPQHATHFELTDEPEAIARSIVRAASERKTVDAAKHLISERHGVEAFVRAWSDVIEQARASRIVTEYCEHFGRYVGVMECQCGTVHQCNKLRKYCSTKKPLDEFVHIRETKTPLNAASFQHCGDCQHRSF